jgi:CheY-like chemotaxis protein
MAIAETRETTNMPNVLIVDDNRNYRQAFTRILLLEGYEVFEAEDSDEALEFIARETMDVVVTDLAMRHPTEGLDLIRQARSLKPHLPIIMISAVGTFEEGAEASRLGARFVISKSKIDEEMSNLFPAIDRAVDEYKKSLEYAEAINGIRIDGSSDSKSKADKLRQIVTNPEIAETVKSEAYDLLMELNNSEFLQTSQDDLDRVRSTTSMDVFRKVDETLGEKLSDFNSLNQDTQESLRTAEFLYVHGEEIEKAVDFSRSVGFSFCFAVENEAKCRMRKKLVKFLNNESTSTQIKSLMEDNRKSLSIFFHQHLLRVQRDLGMEITVDNVFQTFGRILEHRGKYKPDGLKALGIVLLCFGRSYQFKKFDKSITVDNPLGIKGFKDENELLEFATLLTHLQHYRNPYIHPEISEMEKLSKIRQTTFDCMNMIFNLV